MEITTSPKKNNTPQISIGMKRFFTKSKVAFLIVISIAVFCFTSSITNTNFVNAQGYTVSKEQIEADNLQAIKNTVYNKDGTLNPLATPGQLQAVGADLVNIEGPLTPTQEAIDNYYKAVQAGDPNAYINNITPLSNTTTEPSFFNILKDATGQVVGSVFTGIANTVAYIIAILLELITIPIASIFLAIAGKLLDFTVQFTINGASFTAYMAVINNLWVLVRDIFNIAFIFIILYIAITKILGSLGPKTKSTLVSVIISAVFINFSFFITRIIIDAGNIVAMALYSQIENNSLIQTQSFSTKGFTSGFVAGAKETQETVNTINNLVSGPKTVSPSGNTIYLSEILANNLGIQSMYSDMKNFPSFGTAGLIQSFLRLIIILITTFVFFWMVFLLLGRFIMLMFLMVAAPIGFVGGSIPWVSEYSGHWWKSLIDQTILAPIFMFLMLVVLQVAIQSDKVTGTGDDFMIYFKYILIIFLLFKAVEITKKFSGKVGEFANKMASAATGAALAAATGGTALLARQTVGRLASATSQGRIGRTLEARAAKGGVLGSLSNISLKGINGTAKGTMDVRNTLAGKEALGNVRSLGGIDLTGGRKAGGSYGKNGSGFSGWQEQQKKTATDLAQAYDKSMKEHEDRTKKDAEKSSGINFEDSRKEEAKLQKQIDDTKDASEKVRFQNELKTIKEQRVKAEANTAAAIKNKAEENVENGTNEGGNAKITSVQEGIARRMIEKSDLEQKLAALKMVNATGLTEQEKKVRGAELIDLEKGIKEAEKAIIDSREKQGEAREELIKAEMKNASKQILADKGASKAVKEIIGRKKMKQNYADHLRNRVFSINNIATLGIPKAVGMSGRGDEKLARAVESYKEKTKAEKTLAAALEEYSKKEDAPKPEAPKEDKPAK
jgi:hypothetical protein